MSLWPHLFGPPCMQWCIAKNGGRYTQMGVTKGLKVPCIFMITEVSRPIRCQKNPGGWYTPYTRVYPPPIHHCLCVSYSLLKFNVLSPK